MFYFPMAGLSSRFSEAGYNRPKYFLELGNINLFQASLKGFSKYCAGSRSLDDEVIIFNIDTVYDDFTKPAQSFQNYLDVTKLSGDHWSFVVADPEKPAQAMHVEEKRRVSDLCSVGLYQFSSGVQFINAYSRTYLNRDLEQYVAPLYQSMIDDGHVIKFRELSPSRFSFLGTPQEYEEYMQSIRRT